MLRAHNDRLSLSVIQGLFEEIEVSFRVVSVGNKQHSPAVRSPTYSPIIRFVERQAPRVLQAGSILVEVGHIDVQVVEPAHHSQALTVRSGAKVQDVKSNPICNSMRGALQLSRLGVNSGLP